MRKLQQLQFLFMLAVGICLMLEGVFTFREGAGIAAAGQVGRARPIIILAGADSAARARQASSLRERYGLPLIATEDLVREQNALMAGFQSADIDPEPIETSPLLNDLVRIRLGKLDAGRGIILDGYPETVEQAAYVGALVRSMHLGTPLVFCIDRTQSKPPQPASATAKLIRAHVPQARVWIVDGTEPASKLSATIQDAIEGLRPPRS
ncbi:MAG: nucleoside monophosphate kinase [Bryobacteraceae bacterium]